MHPAVPRDEKGTGLCVIFVEFILGHAPNRLSMIHAVHHLNIRQFYVYTWSSRNRLNPTNRGCQNLLLKYCCRSGEIADLHSIYRTASESYKIVKHLRLIENCDKGISPYGRALTQTQIFYEIFAPTLTKLSKKIYGKFYLT